MDLTTGKITHTTRLNKRIKSLSFIQSGTRVVFHDEKYKYIHIWDLTTNNTKHIDLNKYIRSVSYSPDGTKIAAFTENGMIIMDNKKIHNFNNCHSVPCFSADSKQIAFWDKASINIYSLEDNSILGTPINVDSVSLLSFSADGTKIASADNYTVKIWDIKTGDLLHTLSGHKGIISTIGFTQNDTRIVSGSHDKTVKMWNLEKEEIPYTINFEDPVNSLSFNGTKIAVASGNKVYILDESAEPMKPEPVDKTCPSRDKEPTSCNTKQDYTRQALIFHPDKNSGCKEDATEKFQKLGELCNPAGGKRKTRKAKRQKNKTQRRAKRTRFFV